MAILIAFLSIIGLLIIHEFGHFIIAKKSGVKVEEFGIFYPPRLFGKKFGETVYSLNLLPFGAFVKIYGEEGGGGIEEYRSFIGKPIWKRVLIILGGVAAFWVAAFFLLSILMNIGAPLAVEDEENGALINPQVQIVAVAKDSPAELAGLKVGDTLLNFNKVKEVQEFVKTHPGETVALSIKRGKEVFEREILVRASPPEGEGAMGVALARTAIKKYPWYSAPLKGMEACFFLTKSIIVGLAEILEKLLTGQDLPAGAQLVGPVGIGSLIAQAAEMGFAYYLHFIAVIAVYLAIFNILPIPALDGGKLVFLGIEKLRKKPVNRRIEQSLNATFFYLLIALMVWVTIKDITRLI